MSVFDQPMPSSFEQFGIKTFGDLRDNFTRLAKQKDTKPFYTEMSKWSYNLPSRCEERSLSIKWLQEHIVRENPDCDIRNDVPDKKYRGI